MKYKHYYNLARRWNRQNIAFYCIYMVQKIKNVRTQVKLCSVTITTERRMEYCEQARIYT